MPVLLLARGDDDVKKLLTKAIEARYGVRPPAFDTLKIDFTGRVNTRIGPLKTWVPLDVTAQFSFPTSMRWDFTAKPAGVPVRRGVESYDGEALRTLAGGKPQLNNDPVAITSLQQRLWATAALLLTPLSESFVELQQEDDWAFSATNTQINATVHVQLMPDTCLVREVYVDTTNPDSGQEERYRLLPSTELIAFDSLLLPTKIGVFWNDVPAFEIEPAAAEDDPDIPDSVFSLGAEAATS